MWRDAPASYQDTYLEAWRDVRKPFFLFRSSKFNNASKIPDWARPSRKEYTQIPDRISMVKAAQTVIPEFSMAISVVPSVSYHTTHEIQVRKLMQSKAA